MLTKLKNAYNLKAPTRFEWIIVCFVLGILFFSHIYWDMIVTTRHGINVWESLFSGNLLNYYHDNVAPPMTGVATTAAIYPFPVYIIFALWNFPLWLLERFAGVDPLASPLTLMYGKAVLIPFLVGSAVMIRKICRKLDISDNNAQWCSFFFVTNCLVIFALNVVGQYDIFAVFFMLVGLYFYLDKKYTHFIALFAVAVCMKLFALIVFIPLLLLIEKRVWDIVLKGIAVMSLYFISGALIVAPESSSGYKTAIMSFVFHQRLPLTYLHTPIFVILAVLLWIFCYTRDKDNPNHKAMAVYAAFLSLAVLFVSSYTYAYWIILMSPFMCLLCFMGFAKGSGSNRKHTQRIKAIWLVEMMTAGSFIFALNMIGSPVWSLHTIGSSPIGLIHGYAPREAHLGALLNDYVGEPMVANLAHSFTAAFVAGIIAFAVMTYPRKALETVAEPELAEEAPVFEIDALLAPDPEPESEAAEVAEVVAAAEVAEAEEPAQEQEAVVARSVILGRVLLNVIICGLQLAIYFYLIGKGA